VYTVAENYIKHIIHAVQWASQYYFVISTVNASAFVVPIVANEQRRHQLDSLVEDGIQRHYLFLFQS
jgi:hypothetical protein